MQDKSHVDFPPVRGVRRPPAKNLYFALLIRARHAENLKAEADRLGITPTFAEAELRHFQLWPARERRRVERSAEWIDTNPDELDVVRSIAFRFRFDSRNRMIPQSVYSLDVRKLG